MFCNNKMIFLKRAAWSLTTLLLPLAAHAFVFSSTSITKSTRILPPKLFAQQKKPPRLKQPEHTEKQTQKKTRAKRYKKTTKKCNELYETQVPGNPSKILMHVFCPTALCTLLLPLAGVAYHSVVIQIRFPKGQDQAITKWLVGHKEEWIVQLK